MSIIEQAARRLEALQRAGVNVPWAAAGLDGHELQLRVQAAAAATAAPVALPPEAVVLPPVPVASAPQPQALPRPRGRITLDFNRLAQAGLLVPTQTRSLLAEEFRHVKRALVKNTRGKDAIATRQSLIMVTSALPGEGKTFSAINLAMSLAMEIDTSVLLIDADFLRPELPNRLGFSAQRGLLDLLTDDTLALEDVMLETNVPKLTVIPSGTASPMATELVASDAMGALLLRLAAQAEQQIVVFDAPPLLVTNEAKVLASRVGQVLLVVAAGGTPRSAVAAALSELERCPVVMTMLNKVQAPSVPYGYGYGY